MITGHPPRRILANLDAFSVPQRLDEGDYKIVEVIGNEVDLAYLVWFQHCSAGFSSGL
jgi:hypothetical protein